MILATHILVINQTSPSVALMLCRYTTAQQMLTKSSSSPHRCAVEQSPSANEISYSGEKGYAYYLRNKLDFKCSLNDVDESIVMSTIFSLPTKSSTGFDNISSKFLKQIAPTIVKHLTTLIKQVFKGALYRIQILCRRYTFWSYPAG